MSWQFWKKRKRLRVEHSGRDWKAELDRPDPNRFYPFVVVDADKIGVEGKAPAKTLSTTSIPRPTIIEITAPIIWKDSPIGERWGPGRCNETCDQVHAYAVKTSPTTVSFERPCEVSDAGAAEWRARQKR